MQITVHETGIDELLHRLDALGNSSQNAATRRKALRVGIRVAERHAKDDMSTTSPSAPGDPPGVDTGNLKSGIKVGEVTSDYAVLESTADYSAYLEFGTRRMAARPFMRPAVVNNLGEIETAMTGVVDEALDGR